MAIQIYFTEAACGETKYKIMRNDAEFIGLAHEEGFYFNEGDIKLMLEIDKAVPTDRSGNIHTGFGNTDIRHLSTGLKTLLNIRLCLRTGRLPLMINITECGANVLDKVFKEVDDKPVRCILQHMKLTENAALDFIVNNKYTCKGTAELKKLFWRV